MTAAKAHQVAKDCAIALAETRLVLRRQDGEHVTASVTLYLGAQLHGAQLTPVGGYDGQGRALPVDLLGELNFDRGERPHAPLAR